MTRASWGRVVQLRAFGLRGVAVPAAAKEGGNVYGYEPVKHHMIKIRKDTLPKLEEACAAADEGERRYYWGEDRGWNGKLKRLAEKFLELKKAAAKGKPKDPRPKAKR